MSKSPPRKTLTVIGAILVFLGGGRLVVNEVQLASKQARVHGLELKSLEADEDRRRVIRLELDQAASVEATRAITRDLNAAKQQAESLESRLNETQRATLAERSRASEAKAKLEAALAQASQERDAAHALAAARAQELRAEQERSAERARGLEAARALAKEREFQRDAARRAQAAERAQRQAVEGRLAETTEQLQATEEAVASHERVVQTLKDAGVNVARLSGERPMPRVTAVIVHVDTDAAPLEVLIDAGKASGLELGDRLYVLRGGEAVACLEVFAVHPDVSATRLVQGQRQLQLRAGEDVTSTPTD